MITVTCLEFALEIEAEGERRGGRDGGSAIGQSVYIRDPDGNLLEFISYP